MTKLLFLFGLVSLAVVTSSKVSVPPVDIEGETDALYLSYASFCNQTAIERWDCEWCNRTKVQAIQWMNDDKFGTRGYVALDKAANRVVVGFRGSCNIMNYLEDADSILQVKFPHVQADPGIRVAQGFLVAYDSLRKLTLASVAKGLKLCPTCTVTCMGHSLGASMATIGAVDIKANVPGANVTSVNLKTF